MISIKFYAASMVQYVFIIYMPDFTVWAIHVSRDTSTLLAVLRILWPINYGCIMVVIIGLSKYWLDDSNGIQLWICRFQIIPCNISTWNLILILKSTVGPILKSSENHVEAGKRAFATFSYWSANGSLLWRPEMGHVTCRWSLNFRADYHWLANNRTFNALPSASRGWFSLDF